MTKTVFRVLGVVASFVVGGAAIAADAPAVQWKVSDGGNGHWYQGRVSTTLLDYFNARDRATNAGGFLVSLSSAAESEWCFTHVSSDPKLWWINASDGNPYSVGPWIGARSISTWAWDDGSTWNFTAWYPGEPNGGNPNFAIYFGGYTIGSVRPTALWADTWNQAGSYSYVVEWSADCNGDGSVDYGQIQSGELADTNNNGVPDVCELHVTYVQPISGPASGGTAVNINGMNFPTTVSVLFGGVAATDVVVVSSTLITAVTPVGVPGMTVVTVNGVGGEAFYYRSNCQSDLDGSGQVDSSDLGILLLDFGSCGDNAAVAPQQPEPLIFQTTQTLNPVLNKK